MVETRKKCLNLSITSNTFWVRIFFFLLPDGHFRLFPFSNCLIIIPLLFALHRSTDTIFLLFPFAPFLDFLSIFFWFVCMCVCVSMLLLKSFSEINDYNSIASGEKITTFWSIGNNHKNQTLTYLLWQWICICYFVYASCLYSDTGGGVRLSLFLCYCYSSLLCI